MKPVTAILAVLAIAFVSMGIATCDRSTEKDRELNYQTLDAGRLVREKATEPEVKQAGADIEANATVLAGTIGYPEKKVPYSPKASEEIRKIKIEEQKSSGGFIGWLVGGGALAALLAGLKIAAHFHPAAKALEAVVGAGMTIRDKAKAGTLTEKDVKDAYEKANELLPPAARKKVEETVTRVKKKIEPES